MMHRAILVGVLILFGCAPDDTGTIEIDTLPLARPCETAFCFAACDNDCGVLRDRHRWICSRAVSICVDLAPTEQDRCLAERDACTEAAMPLFDRCVTDCEAGAPVAWAAP